MDVGPQLHQSREVVRQFIQWAAVNLFEGRLGLGPHAVRGRPRMQLRTWTLLEASIPTSLEVLTTSLLRWTRPVLLSRFLLVRTTGQLSMDPSNSNAFRLSSLTQRPAMNVHARSDMKHRLSGGLR